MYVEELRLQLSKDIDNLESGAASETNLMELSELLGQLRATISIANYLNLLRNDKGYFSTRLQELDERFDLLSLEQAGLVEETRPAKFQKAPDSKRSFLQEMVSCGKAACKKCGAGAKAHGPYWYEITGYRQGQAVKKYIGKELPANFRPGRDQAKSFEPGLPDVYAESPF